MSRLNLQPFFPADPQSDLVNKLNQNFNQLSNAMGGTLEDQGPTGERGTIGHAGPAGATGQTGRRGSRWFVQITGPTGPDVNTGDYWLDGNADCYSYGATGWNYISSLKRDQNLFKNVTGVIGPSGQSYGAAVAFNQDNPQDFAFVLADDQPEQAGNLNPQGAKFVISTNPDLASDYLMEFSRADLDIAGSTGATSDFVKHPFFSWGDSLNIESTVPYGPYKIDFGGGATGSMSINAANQIKFESQVSSITLADQNMTVGGNIILNAPDGNLLFPNTTNISITQSYANFGTDSSVGPAFNFNFYPSVAKNDGYFNVTKNAGDTTPPFYSQIPFRVTRFFSYGASLYASTGVNLGKFSSGQSGTVLEIRANGKVYTKKTSEKYYNNTNSPAFTWTTP
jgi:hypothetical protein